MDDGLDALGAYFLNIDTSLIKTVKAQSFNDWRYKLTKFRHTRSLELSSLVTAHANASILRSGSAVVCMEVVIVGKDTLMLNMVIGDGQRQPKKMRRLYFSHPPKSKGLAATTSAGMRPELQWTWITNQLEKAVVGTRRRVPLKKVFR